MTNNKINVLDLLRQKAEQILSADKNSISKVETVEVKRIFHELQVYQLELEMQNDELQLATQELGYQKTKFANFFEFAPIGYYVINKSGIVQTVNHAGLQLLRINKLNIIDKPLLLFIHQEDRDSYLKYLRQMLLVAKPGSLQVRLVASSKQVFNVQIEGIALHTATDSTFYLTVTDFTEKQLAEQKLKEAKKNLEIALNASLTGIWEMDIVNGEIKMDSFCCSLYGFEPGTFDGKYSTLINSIHFNDRKIVDDNIRKTITRETDFNIRFRTTRPGENICYIQARAQVIKDKDKKTRFIGTFTDISEKTMMELEAVRIKQEQQQMILAAGLQAEENEKKRISEVLHDGIAQMLYAIKLNIDQVKNDAPAFGQINQLLNQTIRDVRNISFELAPSILTDFGLGPTLEDLTLRLSNQQLTVSSKVNNISKTLNFQLQLNIFRIIQELINNSIKHAHASKIEVEVTRKTKTIMITVCDNGIGFKPDDEKETPKGIGISSIKNRLRLYKGTLKIESQPNKGTTVFISLKH